MSKQCKMIVIYPNEEGATFDMDYYLTTHADLVEKHWRPYGLLDWQVIKMQNGLDNSKPTYNVAFISTWSSRDEIEKALPTDGWKELAADVPGFSNVTPQVWIGDSIHVSK